MVAARNAPFGPVKSKQALITAGMEFEINVTVEELGFKLDTSSGGVPQMERLQDLTVSLSLLWIRNTIYLHGRYVCSRK